MKHSTRTYLINWIFWPIAIPISLIITVALAAVIWSLGISLAVMILEALT